MIHVIMKSFTSTEKHSCALLKQNHWETVDWNSRRKWRSAVADTSLASLIGCEPGAQKQSTTNDTKNWISTMNEEFFDSLSLRNDCAQEGNIFCRFYTTMERQILTFYQGEYAIHIHVAKCDRERLDFSFGQLHLQFVLGLILVPVSTWSLKVHTINIRCPGICNEVLEN